VSSLKPPPLHCAAVFLPREFCGCLGGPRIHLGSVEPNLNEKNTTIEPSPNLSPAIPLGRAVGDPFYRGLLYNILAVMEPLQTWGCTTSPGQEPGFDIWLSALPRAWHGLALQRVEDAGTVIQPENMDDKTVDEDTEMRQHPRNSIQLAGRVGSLLDAGRFPLVTWRDCSFRLGSP